MYDRIAINVGARFGRLVVESPPYRERRPGASQVRSYVPCLCDCGERRVVAWSDLKSGNSVSCGCYSREVTSKLLSKHGEKRTKLYYVWSAMKERCSNPANKAYLRYGGRGIGVCDAWSNDFLEFRDWAYQNGYNPDLRGRDKTTLDRIDNDGDYGPENCRWTTSKVQCNNHSRNLRLTAFGETRTLSQWAEDDRAGAELGTIWARIQHHWHPEDAISTPPGGTPRLHDATKAAIYRVSSIISDAEIRDEVWATIPGWDLYHVSDLGRVKSFHRDRATGTILKRAPKKGGVLTVNLHGGGRAPKIMNVSRLVLMAHVGPPPEGADACHFPDTNPANCRLDNLRWDTRSGNLLDRSKYNKLIMQVIDGQ